MQRSQALNVEYKLIIIFGAQGCSEGTVRSAFEKFGTIEDFHKHTSKDGIYFCTYSKTSEAAHAREKMHNTKVPGSHRQYRVILARGDKSGDKNEVLDLDVFIKLNKPYTVSELRAEFSKYGEVQYVNIPKCKETGKKRDLAFIVFKSTYHAALAVEQCPAHFKAVFSQLKRPEENSSDSFQQPQQASGPHAHDWGGLGWNEPEWSSGPYPGGHAAQYHSEYDPQEDYGFGMDHGPVQGRNKQVEDSLVTMYPHSGPNLLDVIAPPTMNKESIMALFKLMPGLDYCRENPLNGHYAVKYLSAQYAAYAKEKLNGFPISAQLKLKVQFDREQSDLSEVSRKLQLAVQQGHMKEVHKFIGSLKAIQQRIDHEGFRPVPGSEERMAKRPRFF